MKAVIVGATSGIGAAFATQLASVGYDLVLAGRREDVLQSLGESLQKDHAISAEIKLIELRDAAQIEVFADYLGKIPEIGVLVNAAGYGTLSPFLEMDIDESMAMIRVHNEAPMRFCRSILPQMIAKKSGYVINVSSIAGYMPAPGSQLYTATKSALTVFTESLGLAVRDTGVHVQALCPGFTRTDFHSRLEQAATKIWEKRGVHWMSAAEVASISLKVVSRRSGICIPGFRNKILYAGVKLMPRTLYYRIANRVGGK